MENSIAYRSFYEPNIDPVDIVENIFRYIFSMSGRIISIRKFSKQNLNALIMQNMNTAFFLSRLVILCLSVSVNKK